MKNILSAVFLTVLFAGMGFAQNVKVYREQGGAKQVIASGGEIEVRSGGLIDMQAGSTLTINGAAALNISATPTFTGLTVTYGVGAATGVFSGAVTGASFGATGALTGATLATTGAGTIAGDFKAGAGGYVSTMTASNGNWAITGNVVSLGAVQGATVTGTTSVTSPLFIATGPSRLYSRSKAQILALTPAAAGEAYYCSDCTTVAVCISTGTGAGAFTKVTDKSAACD